MLLRTRVSTTQWGVPVSCLKAIGTRSGLTSYSIAYYAPVIFQTSIGLSRNLSLLFGGCTTLVFWVSSALPIWIIDIVGRRKLMLGGAFIQMSCMITLAVTVWDGGVVASYFGAVALFVFYIGFGIGWLAIPWCKVPNPYKVSRH